MGRFAQKGGDTPDFLHWLRSPIVAYLITLPGIQASTGYLGTLVYEGKNRIFDREILR